MIVLSIILFLIFIILGLVHFNWVLGGQWGLDKALPTSENGQKVFNPGVISGVVIGLVLMLFGTFYLLRSGLVPHNLPH